MKVDWSEQAQAHLRGIYNYISRDSTRYAERMVDRLLDCSKSLGTFPASGSRLQGRIDPNLREIYCDSYRIIYKIEPERVVILGVIHGARRLPPEFLS